MNTMTPPKDRPAIRVNARYTTDLVGKTIIHAGPGEKPDTQDCFVLVTDDGEYASVVTNELRELHLTMLPLPVETLLLPESLHAAGLITQAAMKRMLREEQQMFRQRLTTRRENLLSELARIDTALKERTIE